MKLALLLEVSAEMLGEWRSFCLTYHDSDSARSCAAAQHKRGGAFTAPHHGTCL